MVCYETEEVTGGGVFDRRGEFWEWEDWLTMYYSKKQTLTLIDHTAFERLRVNFIVALACPKMVLSNRSFPSPLELGRGKWGQRLWQDPAEN